MSNSICHYYSYYVRLQLLSNAPLIYFCLCPIFIFFSSLGITQLCPYSTWKILQDLRKLFVVSCKFAKLFESYLYLFIYYTVMLMSLNEHSFVKRRQTISNFISLIQFICEDNDNNGQIDTVKTDFSLVFYSSDYRLLLFKLQSPDFSLSLKTHIKSYLWNKINYDFHNGSRSHEFMITSRHPRG